MAANLISQISTANTFQHWLTATQQLIGTANTLTNGNGGTFYANTRLEVGGTNASLNVVTSATINDQHSNTINVVNLIASNVILNGNVHAIGVTTDAYIGEDLAVYGNTTIAGDLTVSGNLVLDSIGYDDLTVSGNATVNTALTVVGNTTLTNVAITGNISTLNVSTTANIGGAVYIAGDLTVGGNITLDSIGFDDLNVAGNAVIDGTTTIANGTVTGTLTVNQFGGTANTQIYNTIANVEGSALAFSIALG